MLTYLSTIKADVAARGGIGIGTDGEAKFIPEGQTSAYPAQLAIDRDSLKKVNENCSINPFYFTKENLCSAAIRAEIILDGPLITLMIFDVEDFLPAKEKS